MLLLKKKKIEWGSELFFFFCTSGITEFFHCSVEVCACVLVCVCIDGREENAEEDEEKKGIRVQ